jgi:hypothetical protein
MVAISAKKGQGVDALLETVSVGVQPLADPAAHCCAATLA